MAYRKVTRITIIEPLVATSVGEKATDYDTDKAFMDRRYGSNGTLNPNTVTYDDVNKKITHEFVVNELVGDNPDIL